jgi:hypothetical protein
MTYESQAHINQPGYAKDMFPSITHLLIRNRWLPDAAADGSGQSGDGGPNSPEPRSVRYELFLSNRNSSFDEC